MNTGRVCIVLLLAVWPALLFAQTQTSHTDVTLVQRDGWTHRHVSVTLSEDGGSVTILRTDGATLVLPVASIATVHDAAGMDITDRFVPGVSPSNRSTYDEFGGQGEEVPLQPVAPVIPPRVFPKMFDVMLSAGIGYGTTSGDFYDGLDSGLLYFGNIRIAISNDKYLKFAYRSVKVFEDQVSVVDENNEYLGEIELTVDVRQYIVSMGFLSAPSSQSQLRGYGEFGIGYADHVLTGTVGPQSESETEGRVMLAGQGGMLVPLGKSGVGLDIAVSALIKLIAENAGEGGGAILAGHLALMVPFGGGS